VANLQNANDLDQEICDWLTEAYLSSPGER
jgi:hypothetical protein